jgi:hypothetical protein
VCVPARDKNNYTTIIFMIIKLYGSEAWTIRKSDESRITSCEMKFMHRTAGYTKWDVKRHKEVLKELKAEPILDYICRYQNNWREHVNRMSKTRIPKAIMYYQPRGKRSLGQSSDLS